MVLDVPPATVGLLSVVVLAGMVVRLLAGQYFAGWPVLGPPDRWVQGHQARVANAGARATWYLVRATPVVLLFTVVGFVPLDLAALAGTFSEAVASATGGPGVAATVAENVWVVVAVVLLGLGYGILSTRRPLELGPRDRYRDHAALRGVGAITRWRHHALRPALPALRPVVFASVAGFVTATVIVARGETVARVLSVHLAGPDYPRPGGVAGAALFLTLLSVGLSVSIAVVLRSLTR